jgi:hypothetical protein
MAVDITLDLLKAAVIKLAELTGKKSFYLNRQSYFGDHSTGTISGICPFG